MKKNIITLSAAATAAIENLQHNSGTYEFYAATLTRLFNYILDQSDEIGMSDTEAVHTLRVLRYLKDDITAIAGKSGSPIEIDIDIDMAEAAEKVDTTFADMDISEESANEKLQDSGSPTDEAGNESNK